MKIYHSLPELIGHTPLFSADNFSREQGLETPILAKLEYFNPAGSIKDRVALNIIEKAEVQGLIQKGSTIIEPTNPEAHIKTTGPEIWADTEGKVDILVAGIGTGGTISGVGAYLKEKNPNLKVIAVEPATSPLLTQGHAGSHGIMGIGANFIPETLNREIYDEVMDITDQEAYHYGRAFGNTEGILVGISSGAALAAAVKVAQRPESKGKNIVAILPDGGERYLSTPMYQNQE